MADRPADSDSLPSTPDYVGLVSFLVKPLLDAPDSLRVDCEVSPNTPRPNKARVWIRLAFEGSDRGRVFGRSGRNIQAVRTVLQAAAQSVGQTLHLDVFSTDADGEAASQDSQQFTDSRPESTRPTRRQDVLSEAPRSPVVKAPPKRRNQ